MALRLRADQKYRLVFNAKRAAQRAGKGAEAGMKAAAPLMEKAIKNITPVDTGALKSSVTVRAIARTKNPRLEVTCRHYGLFVEKGTINMEAQPFITPVMVGQRKNWERVVAREGRRALAKRKR